MGHMTVQHPFTGIIRDELEVAGLRNANQHGISRTPRAFGLPSGFRSSHNEGVTVQVNRMVVHAKVDEAHPDATAQPHDQWRGHGTQIPLKVSQFHSMLAVLGMVLFGSSAHSCSTMPTS